MLVLCHLQVPWVYPHFWWGVVLLGLSGAISCMFTNAVVLPLDVLKTVQQTSDTSIGLVASGVPLRVCMDPLAAVVGSLMAVFIGWQPSPCRCHAVCLMRFAGFPTSTKWLKGPVGVVTRCMGTKGTYDTEFVHGTGHMVSGVHGQDIVRNVRRGHSMRSVCGGDIVWVLRNLLPSPP